MSPILRNPWGWEGGGSAVIRSRNKLCHKNFGKWTVGWRLQWSNRLQGVCEFSGRGFIGNKKGHFCRPLCLANFAACTFTLCSCCSCAYWGALPACLRPCRTADFPGGQDDTCFATVCFRHRGGTLAKCVVGAPKRVSASHQKMFGLRLEREMPDISRTTIKLSKEKKKLHPILRARAGHLAVGESASTLKQ